MVSYRKRLTLRVANVLALPMGVPKKGVDDKEVMAELRKEWEAMSEDEQEAFTKDRAAQLKKDRQMKTIGPHTVAVNAFHDTSSTIVRIENMVGHSNNQTH